MLWEILELTGGLAAMLLPLMLLAVPGIVLFLVAPAALILLVVAIPAALAAAAVALPYLLVRAVRRYTATWRGGRRSAARRGAAAPRPDLRRL
jgi:cytochrome b subunit of formate dehydrogenase